MTTVGSYIGVLNPAEEGRLCIRRRDETGSIIPGQSFFRNWELPGGGAEVSDSPRYDYLFQEGLREMEEEVGIEFHPDETEVFPAYTAMFKGPKGFDLLCVTPVFIPHLGPTKGITMWASSFEVNKLAREFISKSDAEKQGLKEAEGLLSGWGKRMHWACLCCLTYSTNCSFAQEALRTLAEIQSAWR